jgi:hypothetical protein
MGTQGGEAPGYAFGRNVDAAPQGLFELRRCNDLAGMSQQQPQCRQLSGRKMDQRIAAKKRSVWLQPKACEDDRGVAPLRDGMLSGVARRGR